MKFSKPINREVEINGHHFIVSFDDNGIEFRLKGKRKTAHVAWPQVLDIARGEDGDSARELLGLTAAASALEARREPDHEAQHAEASAQPINPPAPQSQADGSAQAASPVSTSLDESSPEPSSPTSETTDESDERSRAITASQSGPES